METTNRKWQHHLSSKGIIPFFLDRLQSHALMNSHQHQDGPFNFPIEDRERDDELTKAYFEFTQHFPYEIYLELTSHCNLKCLMCARSAMKRPDGTMTLDLFKKIIDEIAEKQPYAFIHYYGIGESLIDKNLFEKLEYAKSKGIANSVIFSNGQLLLHNDNYIKLANAGLSLIGVDLDGFRAETYEKVRIGGSFEKAKVGIEQLYSYVRNEKIRTRIEIAYQIYKGINEDDVESFISWCNDNGYEYKLVTMHSWAGLRPDVPMSSRPNENVCDVHRGAIRSSPCPSLYSGFMITWDGKVAKCFDDADVRDCLGDVTSETIEQIWTGKHAEQRQAQRRGIFSGICKTCDSKTGVKLPGYNSRLYPSNSKEI